MHRSLKKKRWGSKVLVRAFEGITFALLLAPRNKVLTFILEKELNLKVKSLGILMEFPHLSPEHTKARTLLPPFFFERLTDRSQIDRPLSATWPKVTLFQGRPK